MELANEQSQSIANTGLQSILLVDDEPYILKSLQRTLRTLNLSVLIANNAKEALSLLAENSVQVILTDHKMPDMTGADLIDVVKREYPEIVSIMLSGQADYEQVIRLFNDRAVFKFIKKPWSNIEVIEAIETAFSQYNDSTFGTWQQRVNRLSENSGSQNCTAALERLNNSNDFKYLAAIEYVNLSEFAKNIGQKKCEQIQAELINRTKDVLSEGAELLHYDAGLLLVCIPSKQSSDKIENQLNHLMLRFIDNARVSVPEVRLELRAAFLSDLSTKTSLEMLIEELKVTIRSTSAITPLIKLDEQLQEKLSRQQKIKSAIQPDLENGRFSLAFQPKVSLQNKVICGAEILLRWQHSTLGWVSPSEFIRLAELDGQISNLGNWVLEHGIEQATRLLRFSPDLEAVAINVSARQLKAPDFVEQLEILLEKYKMPASQLELEITETFISENPKRMQQVLWQLKLLGVSIAVDDFGSGGTAYGYLTYLPIDILKLDKCLVDGLVFSEGQRKLIESLVKICHSLGIKVVAEGAEDKETLKILAKIDCDQVQGFVYSKALSSEDFKKLIVKQPFIRS
ncbi:EAL domain-containing protein [Aliiglaciecola sp.]|nr:EAL domain-containing protein [Aliiglaciecola sp.]